MLLAKYIHWRRCLLKKSIKIVSVLALSLSISVISISCKSSETDVDIETKDSVMSEEVSVTNEQSEIISDEDRVEELKNIVTYLESLERFKFEMKESSTRLNFIFLNDSFTENQKLEELKKESDNIVIECDKVQMLKTPKRYEDSKDELLIAIDKFHEFTKKIEGTTEYSMETLSSNILFLSALEKTYYVLDKISTSGQESES